MSLDTFRERWPENGDGRYYVHSSCLDCAACTEIAPEIFARFKDGYAFVVKQPATPREEERIQEAIRACPMDAIADDGLAFDSKKIPAFAFVTGGSRDPRR